MKMYGRNEVFDFLNTIHCQTNTKSISLISNGNEIIYLICFFVAPVNLPNNGVVGNILVDIKNKLTLHKKVVRNSVYF